MMFEECFPSSIDLTLRPFLLEAARASYGTVATSGGVNTVLSLGKKNGDVDPPAQVLSDRDTLNKTGTEWTLWTASKRKCRSRTRECFCSLFRFPFIRLSLVFPHKPGLGYSPNPCDNHQIYVYIHIDIHTYTYVYVRVCI